MSGAALARLSGDTRVGEEAPGGEGVHVAPGSGETPAPDSFALPVPTGAGPQTFDRAHVEALLRDRPADPVRLALLMVWDHVEALTAELVEKTALLDDRDDKHRELWEDLRALEEVEQGQRAQVAALRDDLRAARAAYQQIAADAGRLHDVVAGLFRGHAAGCTGATEPGRCICGRDALRHFATVIRDAALRALEPTPGEALRCTGCGRVRATSGPHGICRECRDDFTTMTRQRET